MEKAAIRIRRGNDYFGLTRKLKVYMDGEHVGGVGWNRTERLQVAPGKHRFYVKMDWCRSKPVTINLDSGEEVEYSVFLAGGESPLSIFFQLYHMVFNSTGFFELRETE